MLAALPQPLEVREVGGTNFLENLAGPALIAVAAIVAAFVAAYVARGNHREQLNTDRAMRDVEHARREISTAVQTISEALDAMSGFSIAAWSASQADEGAAEAAAKTAARTQVERRQGDAFDSRTEQEINATPASVLKEETEILRRETDALRRSAEAMEKAMDGRQPAAALLVRLLTDTFRLRISIGINSEVVARHEDVASAFRKWMEELAPQDDGRFSFDANPGDGEHVRESTQAFVETCQRWSADSERRQNLEKSPRAGLRIMR